MGVYIPNMSKPKGCRWCPLNHDSMCYVIQPYKTDETNGEQCRNDCPLIEMGDIEYQAYKQISTTLLKRIEERILYGERRADVSNGDLR